MIPYGKIKTRNPSKNSKHKDCPICNPAMGNKARARQAGKREIQRQFDDCANTECLGHEMQVYFDILI